MKTEQVKIKELANDPANVRKHDERNLDSIKASLQRFGQQKPIVVDGKGIVIAGNGTLIAAKLLGWEEIQVVRTALVGADAIAYALADNRTAELAVWDEGALGQVLAALKTEESIDELVTGFTEKDIEELIGKAVGLEELEEGETPEPPKDPITKKGDLWILGEHRLLCADTTHPESVARLLGGATLTMIHADPPYGMGKEKEGIANDNLYHDKLDKFQMEWWNAWRPIVADNGSAYIWGNAEDLWRLWYVGGLKDSERITLRNEIVWSKGSGCGMNSDLHHQYATTTERCLFLMLGQQFLGNQNTDDYWEGYEPIRQWMCEQVEAEGWTKKKVNDITKTHMAGHWLTKCQFAIINKDKYEMLQHASSGKGFAVSYEEFVATFVGLREDGLSHLRNLSSIMREQRTTFNNTHDTMADVWDFMRVAGEERYQHATPKPVEMAGRAIKSSTNLGDSFGVPFGGTCPELIAAEQLGRRCYAMELEPSYCDVIVLRWENLTGKKAERTSLSGKPAPRNSKKLALQETPRNSKKLQDENHT